MKRWGRHSRLLLPTVLALVLPLTSASAQSEIYRWVDGAGEVHFSQGVESVPPASRARAVLIGYDRGPDPSPTASTSPARPSGKVTFTPGQPIMVTAKINDSGSANLMLDTGAARTVINPTVLSTLGVSYANARRTSLKGVTGDPTDVDAVALESIEVAGARHGPLVVLSHDTGFGAQKGDGLLGRDYLDNFTITIDNTAGLLTLTPK